MIGPVNHLVTVATPAQWAAGTGAGLRPATGDQGGMTLLVPPSWGGWASTDASAAGAGAVGADCCGTLYWASRAGAGRPTVFVQRPGLDRPEPWLDLERVLEATAVDRIEVGSCSRWLLDRSRGRAFLLASDTDQVLRVVEGPVVDLAVAHRVGEAVLVTDGHLARYDQDGGLVAEPIALPPRFQPAVVAVDGEGTAAYIAGRTSRRILRVWLLSGRIDPIGDLDEVGPGFRPRHMSLVPSGGMVVAGSGAGSVYELDGQGHVVGLIDDERLAGVRSMAVTPTGEVLVAVEGGIARLDEGSRGVRETSGVYWTPVLDRGRAFGEVWNRAELKGMLAEGASVAVDAISTDRSDVVDLARVVLASSALSDHAKVARLDELFPATTPLPVAGGGGSRGAGQGDGYFFDRWRVGTVHGRQTATGEPDAVAPSFLLSAGHRFLLLRMVLTARPGVVAPTVSELRVSWPRRPYLQYLPAIYQEDPAGADLTDRFLSMFEGVFDGLDRQIDDLALLLDPAVAPSEPRFSAGEGPGRGHVLGWLAGWLDLAVEDGWTPATIRALLGEAPELYARRGTAWAIARTVELITGRRVSVAEPEYDAEPVVLGGSGRLGPRSTLAASTGAVDAEHDPLGIASRFRLRVDAAPSEVATLVPVIRRLLSRCVPAHVVVRIELAGGAVLDHGATVEMRLTGDPVLRLGSGPALGTGALSPPDHGRQHLERSSSLSRGIRLI